MLIRNACIWTEDGFRKGQDIRIRDGRITEVGKGLSPETDEEVRNLEGDYLTPGFVDVHIHAFQGYDTMRGEADIREMSRRLARVGVAAFCPTTMSASPEETRKALEGVRRVMEKPEPGGARVLGAHMEAPFLSPARAGAQKKEFFRDPDWDFFLSLAGDPACVRLITLAPERRGSEAFIRRAREAGIRVSVGHSDATAEQLHLAGDWGADHVTHIFNAQSPLNHRAPGVPGATLVDPRFFCELICDGKHLHPDIIRLVTYCKNSRLAMAITDAMEAAGLPEGEYALGGQKVIVRDGAARLEDGTLAGSVLTMEQAMRNLMGMCRFLPETACRMCTVTPARSVGEKLVGRLLPGSPTPLNRWSFDWSRRETIL